MKDIIDITDDYSLGVMIRAVEESFLGLFEQGKLNGTVHTCIGQELSATAFCSSLLETDYVFSNHRCHGHYMSFTKEYKSLISELLGKYNGVSGGVGGSQHLSTKNFFSNGPQGSLAPIATGIANACKLKKNDNITICFIGDGTMGEGIIYESMNLASLYNLPILFVCENNQYAQSTNINSNLAGSILERAKSFGLKVYQESTFDYNSLKFTAQKIINDTRKCNPSFIELNTYRLKAHSKGDDDRPIKEIIEYQEKDILYNLIKTNEKYISLYKEIKIKINEYIDQIIDDEELQIEEYFVQKKNKKYQLNWKECNVSIRSKQVDLLNEHFEKKISEDDKFLHIGEDIKDPYGGAFKITKGLSSKYPLNVISTPISEAAIVGFGIGMSLKGYKPYIEIMFGDFISYCFDQILSNASKFHHMYNKQFTVPITIRTPMGGGRSYGPTHSQSLEKIFNGLNNIQIIALNTFTSPSIILNSIDDFAHTTILIENKLDYGRLQNKMPESIEYNFFQTHREYPIIKATPKDFDSNLTIITYGGSMHTVMESVDQIFYEFEVFPEIICLTKIYPLPINEIISIVKDSKYILTVEESNIEGGFGSEIISTLAENSLNKNIKYKRVGSFNVPIPSTKNLESQVLINSEKIIKAIEEII